MAPPSGNDIYVVSDLHLSEGWLPQLQRYSRLENFFYDKEFRNFVRAIIRAQKQRGVPATLVLNGDVFDFLAVVRLPDEMALRATGMRLTDGEREFGLGNTQEKSVWKMDRILRGHTAFVAALAELLSEGHYIVVNRGNHDAELFWPGVQQRLCDAIAHEAEAQGLTDRGESLIPNVQFNQWFYYEPKRFYIEHGNQYEASNAFKYVLNPVLPPEYHRKQRIQLDYPMGSLFVRFIYNKMKLLDPFTTHFVTLEQYVRITYHHNFMDLLRTGTLHFPFFFKAIREARVFEQGGMEPIQHEHEEQLEALAARTGLGDKVHQLQGMASRPVGTTKYNLLKEMLRPVVRSAMSFIGIAILSLVSWFFIFSAIQDTHGLASTLLGKASLLAVLAVVTFGGLFLLFSYVNRALHRSGDPVHAHAYQRGEQIATILGVPCVTMGHTHKADLRPFTTRPGLFANTGTWIPHPGPWDSLRPNARQFTFAIIRGTTMRLRRWNDPHLLWEPVTLLEEYRPTTFERLLSEGETTGEPGAEDS